MVKMSEMPSNAAAQSDALPMQGKVMKTIKTGDGQVVYVFEQANGNGQYTKSTLEIGQAKHSAYKLGVEAQKEFRLPSGKRIDFLDPKNAVIYEYKPFNSRSESHKIWSISTWQLL